MLNFSKFPNIMKKVIFFCCLCLQEWFENWTFENCSPLARKYKTDKKNPLTKVKILAISFFTLNVRISAYRKLLNLEFFCKSFVCIKCLRKEFKLWKIWKHWNFEGTRTSYEKKIIFFQISQNLFCDSFPINSLNKLRFRLPSKLFYLPWSPAWRINSEETKFSQYIRIEIWR